jgi:hypothetical protein
MKYIVCYDNNQIPIDKRKNDDRFSKPIILTVFKFINLKFQNIHYSC